MTERTTAAFNSYRAEYGPALAPTVGRVTHPDDCVLLGATNGLQPFVDGPVEVGVPAPTLPPLDYSISMPDKFIWVVRDEDVVYALENCAFGRTLNAGSIKHTNLTSGAKAFAGGELRFLQEDKLIVNGCSGRYPVKGDAKMRALGKAFVDSGYHVWCMGFDPEAGLSYPLGSVDSEWIG